MGHTASRVAAGFSILDTNRYDYTSGERTRLLPSGPPPGSDPEQVGHDGCFPPHGIDDLCPANPYADLPVYTTIHRIRRDIIEAIDDPYSIEQLRDPRMNLSVVRPLVDKFYEKEDVSMVYCLLVNRAQFQREQLTQPHQQSVCTTRALLCELLANRILRRFHEDHTGAQGLLLLAQILVGGFDPFQGAPPDIMTEENINFSWTIQSRTGAKRKLPALEIAIISESKIFLSSQACQKVVNAIYEGRVIYTPTSFIDIVPDHYKQKPISLYNPRRAPLFNQYRLIVPRTRNILEVLQFMLLLALYICVMIDRDPSKFGTMEMVFIVYTMGWVLDQFASILEHGWHVYTQNLWSFLDVTFSAIFWVYLILRIHGWRTGKLPPAQQAVDVLAMGAPVLVPRLAFNLMSENMLFVSLRAMMKDFAVLTLLSVWCFGGFLLSMIWLADGIHHPITISKWMLWVWFGLDATGIQHSVDFHWLLGPILMVAFAFLGNTLFLTILVSMLSTTFSTIVANATAEIQFRRAVLTLEGVKSDAIFAYQPPFNILALITLIPLKFILTPRWFHKINVAAVRTLSAPLLLLVGIIERRTLWAGSRRQGEAEQLPNPTDVKKGKARPSLWARGFSVHGDIQAVFDTEPPQEIEDEIAEDDDLGRRRRRRASTNQAILQDDDDDDLADQLAPPNKNTDTQPQPQPQSHPPALRRTNTGKSRRDSVAPFAGLGITGKLRHLLEEGSSSSESSSESGEGGVRDRLQKLEGATARIEALLVRLCAELDNDGKSEKGASMTAKDTGRLQDLDVSGTADLDD